MVAPAHEGCIDVSFEARAHCLICKFVVGSHPARCILGLEHNLDQAVMGLLDNLVTSVLEPPRRLQVLQ